MKLPNKQKGLSSIGWLFVGVTIFFYFTIAAKIVPIYLDDMSVAKAIDKLGEKAGASAYDNAAIINAIDAQFEINNIRDINLRQEGVITVNRESNGVVVEINYVKVVSIFKNNKTLQNMDIVVTLKHSAQLR
jgi:hypothetical protein